MKKYKIEKCCFNCEYSHTLDPYEPNADFFNERYRLCGALKIERYHPMYERRTNCRKFNLQPKEQRNGVPYYKVIK